MTDVTAPAAPTLPPKTAVLTDGDVPAGAPDTFWVVLAYVVMGAGVLAGWLLWKYVKPLNFVPVQGMSIFAALYIFAQIIERVMEPFSSLLGSAKDDKQVKFTKKEALQQFAQEPSPKTRALVAQVRRNRTVIIWAIASLLAMLASGGLGLFLLRSVGLKGAPVAVDVLVTGLAIGSGTKPLHDLISNLQSSSTSKEESAAKAS